MLLKPERKEKKKPIFAAKKNDNLSLKNVIMVTINLKLGKKRQQIIHGGKRCEKKKKLKKYICVVCSFYACCIFRSHLCIQNWCRRITIPSPFTPFVSYKKKKMNEIRQRWFEFWWSALSENQQFLFNVSLIPPLCIDNQKMLNNYFSLFHLPVMEIQTPFLPKE